MAIGVVENLEVEMSIEAAVQRIDQGLAEDCGGRELISTAEASDLLLDVRQLLAAAREALRPTTVA